MQNSNHLKQPSGASAKPAPLTDFSIESIMGAEQLSNHSSSSSSVNNFMNIDIHPLKLEQSTSPIQRQHQTIQVNKPKKYRPKNFHCPACKMAFSNNGQLKNHLRIHTGERPFKCNQTNCNKTFTRNEELTRHKLIHTGVRPHTCNSCGKGFGRKDHLKKHVRTHDRKRYKKRMFLFNNHHQTSEVPNEAAGMQQPANVQLMPNSIFNAHQQIHKEQFNQIPPSIIHPTTSSDLIGLPIQPAITSSINTTPMQQPAIASQIINSIAQSQPIQPNPIFQFPNSSIMPPTSSADIQQFASDYWSQWYKSLMGVQCTTTTTHPSSSHYNSLSSIIFNHSKTNTTTQTTMSPATTMTTSRFR